LSKRDRSLIVCGALMAMGRYEQLTGHLGRALDTGVTQGRDHRIDHPPRLLFRLADRDDRRGPGEGGVRDAIKPTTNRPGEFRQVAHLEFRAASLEEAEASPRRLLCATRTITASGDPDRFC
jgi:hypothetical protein